LRDGTLIYERSFAIIRAEADLSRFSEEEADVAVRMVHACGAVEAAENFVFADGVVTAARRALRAGAAILCDSEMVSHGITRARLPAQNPVICTLRRTGAGAETWNHPLGRCLGALGRPARGRSGRHRQCPDLLVPAPGHAR
jgi:precorrin isomerase